MPAHVAGILGVIGVVLVAVGGLVLRSTAGGVPTAADVWWHDLLVQNRNGFADLAAQVLHTVGGTSWMTAITVVCAVGLLLARRWREATVITVTFALSISVNPLLKNLIARVRPDDGLIDISTYAFPSGHTTTAAAFAVAIALIAPRAWVLALGCAWMLLMAASRTYLLVHWLTDVVASVILGTCLALLVSAAAAFVSRAMSARGGAPH